MLSDPRGIFVDLNLSLYVADCGNHRIQFFRLGQRNGTTVMGNGSNESIVLQCPSSVILDSAGHLFVADSLLRRIIGWSPHGYTCIASCSNSPMLNSTLLMNPNSLAFDTHGNLYVADESSHRIETFLIMNNDCGKFQLFVSSL